MNISDKFKQSFQRLKNKASDMTASEEEQNENPENQNPEDVQGTDGVDEENDTNSGIDESDDISEADRATMLRKKHILTGVGCVGLFVLAMVGSNVLFKSDPSKQPKDPPIQASVSQQQANSTPASGIPSKYSDIAKYSQKNTDKNQNKSNSTSIQPKKSDNSSKVVASRNTSSSNESSAPRTTSVRPQAPSAPSVPSNGGGSSRAEAEALKAQKEAEKAEQEAMESAIAFTNLVTGNTSAKSGSNADGNSNSAIATQPAAIPVSHSYFEEPNDSVDGQYALQAGSVIQATLITGITSDMPSGDVVAQVRQNIYDSLTGEHLLIPQGSKLIGKSGSAGGRGNARIGVSFNRIILPTGESITLPDQKAIDGVGYLGMKDQYTEHTGKLYSTGIMTALIAAAAQSATGDSSGSDNRSPGQEAVSGAVADVLDTMKTIIDRQSNVSPTITIRPGFEFSVFINQDLMLSEYQGDF